MGSPDAPQRNNGDFMIALNLLAVAGCVGLVWFAAGLLTAVWERVTR